MVTYRKAKPEERDDYVRFTNMVFNSAGDPVRFETDIPKVYGPGVDSASMQNLAVDDETGIRGLVAVLPGELYAGGKTLRTGYIGTVSVHPEARGEGHMKRLMAMALEDMRKNGVDLALLNGQRQRYEYFGFAQGGIAYQIHIGKRCIRHALKDVCADGICFELVEGEGKRLDEVVRLHQKRRVRCRRDKDQFVAYCLTYKNHLWAATRDGELLGYCVANEKKDFICECCAVSMAALDAMLKAWREQFDLDMMTLLMPAWETEVLRHLGTYAESIQLQPNVFVNVFNPRAVVEAMLTAKAEYGRLADGKVAFEMDGERFTVTVRNNEVTVADGGEGTVRLSALDANRLMAYPFDYEGRPDVPDGWFPLPFYFAAPDEF